MKHVRKMTKNVPAKAFLPEGHPSIEESAKGFLQSPVEVISTHLQKDAAEAE
jgi:hypothetical protein